MTVLHNMGLKDGQVVIFLDILGFSETTLRNENTTMDKLGLIINLPSINKASNEFDYSIEYQQEKKIKFLWVSDSIVITTDADNINTALHELGKIINDFYCSHFALRGAITVGKLYHEENIWGPAFVKAVGYEKQANFPRIIINKADYEKLNVNEDYEEFFKETENIEFLYFDFFDYHISKENNGFVKATSQLYSNFITTGLNECNNDKVLAKYFWLANSFKDNLIKHHNRIDDLLGEEYHLKIIDRINRSTIDGMSHSFVRNLTNKKHAIGS